MAKIGKNTKVLGLSKIPLGVEGSFLTEYLHEDTRSTIRSNIDSEKIAKKREEDGFYEAIEPFTPEKEREIQSFQEQFRYKRAMEEYEKALKETPRTRIEEKLKKDNVNLDDYRTKKERQKELYERTRMGFLDMSRSQHKEKRIKDGTDNIFNTFGDFITRTLTTDVGFWAGVASGGIKRLDDKESRELDFLTKELNKIDEPAKIEIREDIRAEKKALEDELSKIQNKIQEYTSRGQQVFHGGKTKVVPGVAPPELYSDLHHTNLSLKKLNEAEDLWAKAIEDPYKGVIASYFSGLGQNWENTATLGLKDIATDAQAYDIAKKIEKGGTATKAEQNYLRSYQTLEDSYRDAFSEGSAFMSGVSTAGSVGFVAQIAATKGTAAMMSHAVKKAVKGVTKKAIKNKIIKDGINMLAASSVTPMTYETFLNKKMSNIDEITNVDGKRVFIANDEMRMFEAGRLADSLEIADYNISQLEEKLHSGDESVKEQLERLKEDRNFREEQLMKLLDEEGNVKKNIGSALAYTEAVRSTMAEYFTEKYVGKFADKHITSKIGKALGKLPGSGMVKDAGLWASRQARKTKFGNLAIAVNRSIRPGELIQSPIGEFFEEGAIQFIPSFTDDYEEQLNELSKATFWKNVAVSSLFMSGGRGIVQGAKTGLGRTANEFTKEGREKNKKSREEIKKRGEMLDYIRRIDKSSDEQIAQEIVMGTYGAYVDPLEYAATIARLRNKDKNPGDGSTQKERNAKANDLEKKSFINTALRSLNTDTQKELKKVFERQLKNKNLSAETKANLQTALGKLNKYEEIQNNNKYLINGGILTNLQINKDVAEEVIKDIEQKLAESNTDAAWQAVQDVYKRLNIDVNQHATSLEEFFENTENIFNVPISEIENSDIQKVFDLMYMKSVYKKDLKYYDRQINYEKDPQNYESIRKRENNRGLEGYLKNVNGKEFQKRTGDESTMFNMVETKAIEDRLEQEQKRIEEEFERLNTNLSSLRDLDGTITYNGNTYTLKDGSLFDENNVEVEVEDAKKILDETYKEIEPLLKKEDDVEESSENPTQNNVEFNELFDDSFEETDSKEDDPEDFAREFFSRFEKPIAISDKLKEATEKLVEEVEDGLGKKPNFNDVIEHLIRTTSRSKVEERFRGYEQVFKAVGIDTSNASAVYNKHFNRSENLQALLDEAETIIIEEDTVDIAEQKTKNQERTVSNITNPVVEVDVENNTVTSDTTETTTETEDRRVLRGDAKFAYNFQESVYDEESDTWTVKSRKLKTPAENDVIDNKYILDSDFMSQVRKEKGSLSIRLWDNPEQYFNDGKTWGQIKENAIAKYGNNTPEYNEWYKNNVPMVVVYQGKISNNKPVPLSMVHSTSWYNPVTVSNRKGKTEQEKVIQEGRENISRIRSQVLKSGNTIIELKDNAENSFGQLHEIEKGSTPLSLNESNPDSTIAILETSGELRTGDKTYFDGIVVNKKSFARDYPANSAAYIVQIGTNKDGKPLFMALKAFNESPIARQENLKKDLNQNIQSTIKAAVLASTVLRNKNNIELLKRVEKTYGITLSKAQEIQKSIKENLNIDLEHDGIAKFVSMFTMTYYDGGISKIIDSNRFKEGITYLNSNADGSLGFIKKGSPTKNDKRDVNIQKTVGQKPGQAVNIDSVMNSLSDLLDSQQGLLSSVKTNISLKNLDRTKGKQIPMFDENGNQTESKTLESVYKDFLKTNIISHKIETIDGKEKYITDVQPMFFFDTVQESSQKVPEQQITEVKTEVVMTGVKEQINSIQNNTSLTAKQKNIAIGIIIGNAKNNTTFNSRLRDAAERFESLETNSIEGLTSEEQNEIVTALKNLVIKEINFSENISLKEIKEKMKGSVEKFVTQQIEDNNSIIDVLKEITGMENVIGSIQTINTKLEKVLQEQDKIVGDTGTLTKEFNNIFSVDFKEDATEDSFSQSFLEKDVKLSYSSALKLSLFGIEKNFKDGTNRGAFGFTEYHSADFINGKLIDITTKIPSNWNTLIASLKAMKNITNQDFYDSMVERFEALPEHLKNELLYNTIGKQNTLFKILNRNGKSVRVKTKDGKELFIIKDNEITVLDENSSKSSRKMLEQIKNDFLSNSFLSVSGNSLNYDKSKLDSIKQVFEDLIKEKSTDFETIKSALAKLNIKRFSDNTLKYLLELTEQNPTAGIYGKSGLITILTRGLKNIVDSSKIKNTNDYNIIDDATSALNKLVNIEVMLNKTFTGGSIYVGGKTIQSFIANTSIYDTNQKLSNKEDTSLIETLLKLPYTSRNYILEALSEDPEFREMYSEIGFSSNESYKVDNRDVPENSDIDKIAEQDKIAVLMGLYMSVKGRQIDKDFRLKKHPNLKFRKGKLPSHTISDKGRVVYLTSLLLDLSEKDISFSDGKLVLGEDVLNFLREQIFDSELERIKQSYSQNTDISGYDLASKVFLNLPSLNSIEIEVNGEMGKIHDVLNSLIFGQGIENDILSKIEEQANEKIKEYIESELNNKIDENGNGYLSDLNFYTETDKGEQIVSNLDSNFIGGKPGENNFDKLRFAMAEFVMNNMIHNISTQQLYLGDLAFYSKDEFIPSKNVQDLDGNTITVPDANKISDSKVYGNMMIQIGSNLQKRTALLIAPGKNIADSSNPLSSYAQNYIHLALNDTKSMSSSMKELIESQYGEFNEEKNNAWKELQKTKAEIKYLEEKNDNTGKIKYLQDKVKGIIKDNFSEIKDYFNITGTDAQEYTTWETHLDLLLRQGKITREQHDNFSKKIEGETLAVEDIDIIMQPVKPVHTGMVYDDENNVMRPVYIKASSFPLLPGMTKNLKIDGLRKAMQALEKKRGVPVHVSYQSANKIGSKNTNLSLEDFSNNSLEELENNGAIDSGLSILPYSDYKIQQETPSKEQKAYKKGIDSHVIMGSQFFKSLFGNFLSSYNNPVFDNRFSKDVLEMASINDIDENGKLTGKQMYELYTSVYFKYSDILYKQLKDEIGLEKSNFNEESTENQNKIIENLQKVLEKEISGRGYPEYLKESVKLINEDGKNKINSVLLFDSNRYKFESLLLSIVSNRLITHTLPGNSHISASSNGFERKTEFDELTQDQKSSVVWLNGYQSELKSTVVTNKDGKKSLQKSQVLIKAHWKYRDSDGNLKYVDLTDPRYTTDIMENGKVVGKQLNKDMIDPELLEMFSYRIPTSSHQSGAIIEVAGFLPSEMQDLLVVPKEHTVQFGEDYDIDKRQVYKNNYHVNRETGKIEKIKPETLVEIRKERGLLTKEEKTEVLTNTLNRYLNRLKTENRELYNAAKLIENTDEVTNRMLNLLFGEENAEDLHQEIKTNKELQKMLVEAYKYEVDSAVGISDTYYEKLKEDFELKLMENALIDTFLSIYSTLDNNIQQKIYKPLVTDVAEETTKEMENYLEEDKDYSNFSIFSDDYQRYLLEMGSDGKDGVGIHSNAVTFEAQLQRLSENKKVNLNDYKYDRDGNTQEVKFQETVGGFTFSGNLGGNVKTLDGGREIAEQHSENQNVSVDNISKQIMGKRNENSETMPVYAFMAHLGFDRTLDDVFVNGKNVGKLHIPSLLLNQPIIRDYVRIKKKYGGMSSEFVQDVESKIIEELSVIYGFNFDPDTFEQTGQIIPENLYNSVSQKLLGQTLFDNLKENVAKTNPQIQRTVLQKFLKYKDKSAQLSQIQQLFNISTSKLGVSYFETLQRIEKMNEIARGQLEGHKNNFTSFIGEVSETPVEGYEKIGSYYWKPTTVEGKMLINSILAANSILPVFFPYNSDMISSMVDSILVERGIDPGVKSQRNLKARYKIMTEFVTFVNSRSNSLSRNLESERKRLFFDSKENKSLGSILNELSQHPIMQNPFLADLSVIVDPVNGITTIRHTVDEQTSLDRSTKYESFKNLLKDNTVLGVFNGEQLKVSDLAQDLIAYSLLSDDMNGAVGFKNYIPQEYFDIVGDNKNNRSLFEDIANNKNEDELTSLRDIFIRQYFQHYSTEAKKLSKEEFDRLEPGKTFKGLKFISVRIGEETVLHEFKNNAYTPIDKLGIEGVYKEYDTNNSLKKSSVEDNRVYEKTNPYTSGATVSQVPIEEYDKTLQKIDSVEKLVKIYSENKNVPDKTKKIFEEILPFVNSETKLVFSDDVSFGKFKLEENTIYIGKNLWKNALRKEKGDIKRARNLVSDLILEEVMHSITVTELHKWVNSDKNTGDVTIKPDAPEYIKNLVRLYELARTSIPFNKNNLATYGSQNIEEFVANVFTNPEYRDALEESKKGFLQDFLKTIRNMFRYLKWKMDGKYPRYDDLVFENIMAMLHDSKGIETKAESPKKDILSEVKENNPVQPVERPLDRIIPETEITNPEITSNRQEQDSTSQHSQQDVISNKTFSYNGITIDTDFQLTEGQANALKRLIDFTENPNEDSVITLSGYAGTGKTSIIKYLERYKEAQDKGGTNFIYAAPTHAATVYLGLNTGELPSTIQSMVYERFDPISETMQPIVTKKFEANLSIFANNILVIDEASMIANKDLSNITRIMEGNGVKIIFMGDKAQLPEVSTKTGDKSVSKVFTDYESIQLTEVKRTSDNSILGVLTEIRNNPDGKLPIAENTDTMQYVDTAIDFKRKAFQKIKEDPENTVFISYTNKGVQTFNSQVREGLGFTGGLQKGESIIGYGGYNSKKVEDGNLANSVKYTVENVEMVNTNEYKGMDIYFSSNILEKIPDTKSKGKTLYLPLDNSDVIPAGNLSNEDYQKNNEYISKQFRDLYFAKQRAKQTKRGQDWGIYYNELQKISTFMQKIDLGADYIYNPVTDKFEIVNSTHSKLLKDNPELKVGKGIDYGYAITIHKSQGATFSNVFFDASSVPTNTAKLIENGKQVGTEGNSLLYVGMSRASKNLTVLKGDNNKLITENNISLSDINKLPKNEC